MTLPLLHTKLHLPILRPGYVPRPRLVERLRQAARPAFILISAPPGFGKTTLLAEWAAHFRIENLDFRLQGERQLDDPNLNSKIPNQKFPFLSLDAADNDWPRFLTYLVAALQAQHPGLGQAALGVLASQALPQAGPAPGGEAVFSVLINEIAALESPLTLVLDDYHLIQSPAIHQSLAFLLDHLPPNLQLAIASRADPPFPLGRLRARSQILELRAADLRFTPAEALAFLNTSMGLELSAGQAAALDAHTEGWAAGLQLAAVSLQGRLQSGAPGSFEKFVQQFSGENRYILDYLLEEVLAAQPPHVQDFLLRTSILEQLSADLCDAILFGTDILAVGADLAGADPVGSDLAGKGLVGADLRVRPARPTPSQSILETLESANLFLLPLDERRQWYRYHPLFADLLRSRLLAGQGPQAQSELHRRAAEWFEDHGDLEKAVGHFLASQDYSDAARAIEQAAPALLFRGELNTLLGWLGSLPQAVLHGQPQLCLFMAWALTLTAQVDAAEEMVRLLEAQIAAGGIDPGLAASPAFLGQVASLRALIASVRYDVPATIGWAQRALELLPPEDMGRGVVSLILGGAYWLQGQAAAAEQALGEAARLTLRGGNVYAALLALRQQAQIRLLQGRLAAAEEVCRQALEIARQSSALESPGAGQVYIGLGEIYLERHELEQAAGWLQRGLALGQRTNDLSILVNGGLALARLELLNGHVDEMQRLAAQVQHILEAAGLASMLAVFAARRAHLAFIQGDRAAVLAWRSACALQPSDALSPMQEETYLMLGRAMIWLGEARPALELLERLLAQARASGLGRSVISILNLQALAFRALSQPDKALPILAESLALAHPEGFLRIFADEGPEMGEAILDFRMKILDLSRQDERQALAGYINRLLPAFPGLSLPSEHVLPPQSKISNLNSKILLSSRELEVLRLLADGLSSREIADRLVIAFGTARTHVKNIYRKLEAHNRVQLVENARRLDLL